MAIKELKVEIPDELMDKYGHGLAELPVGDNSLVGYESQKSQIKIFLQREDMPNVILLGGAGSGKTATVEQVLYDSRLTDEPMVAIALRIEKLMGNLGEEAGVGAMASLLDDMASIRDKIKQDNPGENVQVVLFIDEIHKLYSYGQSTNGSSLAMNALKEGMARGLFPVIGATTDYEYRSSLVPDNAFVRRFQNIIMETPTLKQIKLILRSQLEAMNRKSKREGRDIVETDETYWLKKDPVRYADMETYEEFLSEVIDFADAYVRDEPDPAKSIKILSSCYAYARYKHEPLSHEALQYVLEANGYNTDSKVTARAVREHIQSQIFGQPLAIHTIADAINLSFYTKRDYKRPLMTVLAVGTTGVGKTATAKALAEAYFGRRDAMITLNGGDYSLPESALQAQHDIGDAVITQKQMVILLDELEKADPTVLMALMRVIDEGIVLDSHNNERSITNTIIFATSNLGSEIFAQLHGIMDLDHRENPDELRQSDIDAWEDQVDAVRESLLAGDGGRGNGLRPEFLERFSLLIPFLPLSKAIKARIAETQLDNFKAEEHDIGYKIAYAPKQSMDFWRKQFATKSEDGIVLANTVYNNVSPLSVLIAEDKISSKSNKQGARAIHRYINTTIKTMLANEIEECESAGLNPHDYYYVIATNGKAFFETDTPTHEKGNPIVMRLTREEISRFNEPGYFEKLRDEHLVEQAKKFK